MLAEKYAAELRTHVGDVTDRLAEFWAINNCPDPQSVIIMLLNLIHRRHISMDVISMDVDISLLVMYMLRSIFMILINSGTFRNDHN